MALLVWLGLLLLRVGLHAWIYSEEMEQIGVVTFNMMMPVRYAISIGVLVIACFWQAGFCPVDVLAQLTDPKICSRLAEV